VSEIAGRAPPDEVDHRPGERERARHDQQQGDDDVDRALGPADPGVDGEHVARPHADAPAGHGRAASLGFVVCDARRDRPPTEQRQATYAPGSMRCLVVLLCLAMAPAAAVRSARTYETAARHASAARAS
jgi:hypothetical protein